MAITEPASLPARPREPAWYRSVLRVLRAGTGALPTTRAGAEMAIVLTVVGWRIGTLAQILPAFPSALRLSSRPWLNVVLLAVVLVESAALIAWVVARRGYISLAWTSGETLLGCWLLLAERWYVPVGERVGTWVGWAPGLAVNIAAGAALGCPKRSQTLAMTALLAAAYVAASYPEVGRGAEASTVVSNVVTFFVFAVVGRAMASFVRRFGADTDAARQAAVRATHQAEQEQRRRLLHDPASLLRYLADPDLDPRLAQAVRIQALAQANRIRAYLSDPDLTEYGTAASPPADRVLLVQSLRSAAAGFTDLRIELILDLADDVVLDRGSADSLEAAVATAMLNVRQHAGPDAAVVIHADHDRSEAEWEVVIRDDGVGFDQTVTPNGFGLSHLIVAALAEHRIDSHIRSAPGSGTTITLRGRDQ